MCLSDDLSLVIILTQYLQVVFEPITNVLYWRYRGLRIANPVFSFLQWYSFKYVRAVQFYFILFFLFIFFFFRSLRGAVLRFLRAIAPSVVILNLKDTCQFPFVYQAVFICDCS